MRRSSRLVQGNNDNAGIPDSLPTTPHHLKSGPALDQLITTLEAEFQLGLKVRDKQWTPKKSATGPLADKVVGQIKHLFFSSRPTLDATIEEFRGLEASNSFVGRREQRLSSLNLLLLKNKTKSPMSRAGTPTSRPQKVLQTEQQSANQPTRASGLFSNYKENQDESKHHSYHTAIEDQDPGSPTDSEEDAYFTPPSPTPQSSTTGRRTLFERGQGTTSSNLRKRSLDESGGDGSPKFTRTSAGKEPVDLYPVLPKPTVSEIKIPPLNMARSFLKITPAGTSANTSFDTLWSQQTLVEVDSATTSFMTDGAGDDCELFGHQLVRKSSLSNQLLRPARSTEDISAFEREKRREQDRIFSQDASRETTSTYGSMDDDALCIASHNVETKNAKSAAKMPEMLPPLSPKQQAESSGHAKETPKLSALQSSAINLLMGTDNESPHKLPWWIRDLSRENLFTDARVPSGYVRMPYFFHFICLRIAIANKVTFEEVLRATRLPTSTKDADAFWASLQRYKQPLSKEPSEIWTASKRSFEGYTFKGKVSFRDSWSGPVFKLDLLPVQAETSCLLQRMFGSDRFLYLTFPSFDVKSRPDRFSVKRVMEVEEQWKIWALKNHQFLGREWKVFHVEPIKKNGIRKDDTKGSRVVLFATQGPGIETISVYHMIDKFFSIKRNGGQNVCKAFARLDLALSRTLPTIVLKPSQIRRIRDTIADGTPEARDFDDTSLDWSEQCRSRPVMNDGCARISVGAAKMIWDIVKKLKGFDGGLPSAFQGRIGGAKGMWMLSAEPHTTDPAHLEIWIEITTSQQKFEPAEEDENDKLPYNKHRLTFGYVKHSFIKGATDLHISFLPILENRGVQKDVLMKHIQNGLDEDREKMLKILSDPKELHSWLTKQGAATPVDGILTWQAALPVNLGEKAKLLVRSELEPTKHACVAKLIKRVVRQRQLWMEEKLRAPLSKATFMLGLADPLGVLKPGEVHVNFSEPFKDQSGGTTYRSLAGEDVLVARQPACRRSDIQKMRAISHPLLSHLVDVIVFPSRGQYPVAGKLQGGDYDGDTFWTCWEHDLVKDFRNAPAPLNDLDPKTYGIKRDTRKLDDVVNCQDPSTIDRFLEIALTFRMSSSLLGLVTNFAEKFAYKENRIHSVTLNALYDIHDLLVDAPKQALTYTPKDFERTVFEFGCGDVKIPAYKRAMEESAKRRDFSEEELDIKKEMRHNSKNLLDYLYFAMRLHNRITLKTIHDMLPKDDQDDNDPDLQYPYLNRKENGSQVVVAELKNLTQRFDAIITAWKRNLGDKSDLTPDRYNKLIDGLYADFCALLPSSANATNPEIMILTSKILGQNHPTYWEYIRASALYTMFPKKHSFVWIMAGRLLARLKAGGNKDTYNTIPVIAASMKPKPDRRTIVSIEQDEGSDDDLESVLERFDG